MATDDPTCRRAGGTASADRRTEHAVLGFLIDEHPTRLTLDEVLVAFDPKDYAEKDAIRRAVRELTGAGLLRADGDLIDPTRAAIHFERLEAR